MDLWSLIIAIGAILGTVGFFRLKKTNQKITDLENKLNEIYELLKLQTTKDKRIPPKAIDVWGPESDKTISPAPVIESAEILERPPAPQVHEAKQQSDTPSPVVFSHEPDLVDKAFNWLKDNWAGFLGVSILVLGITFGTVYLSFFASPFIRFLLLIGVGLLFLGVAKYLQRNPLWNELAGWLLSASGAIILFSVLATGFIPALHFYESPNVGLLLLIAGLAYNIILAYAASKEIVAAVHVIISLIALMIVPKDLMVFFAASAVTLAGIALSVKRTWTVSLLGTYVAFFIYHLMWFAAQSHIHEVALYAVIANTIVGISALLVHYRQSYQTLSMEQNLFSHLTIWLLFALQLALYNLGFAYLFIPLGLAAVACFALSLYAKKKGIEWLFVCDATVGQMIALLAIVSLSRVNLAFDLIAWIAFIETLIFTTITYWFRYNLLSKIGSLFMGIAFIVLCGKLIDIVQVSKICIISCATLIPLYATRCFIIKRQVETVSIKVFESIYPSIIDAQFYILAFLTLLIGASHYQFGYVIFLALTIAMLFNTSLINQNAHRISYLAFATLLIIFSWFKIPLTTNIVFCVMSYLLAPAILMICILKQKTLIIFYKNFEDLWVYLVGFHLGIFATLLLWPYSPFLPGIVYLALGTLFFEAGHSLYSKIKTERSYFIAVAASNMAVLFLFSYVTLYLLLYVQSEASFLNIVSLTQILTIIAIAISFYWFFSKPVSNTQTMLADRITVRAYPFSQSLTFDVAIVLLICLLITTFSAPIHPIGYSAIGIMLVIPLLRQHFPTRAMVYALCLLMATCIQVAIVSSKWASPLSNWYQNTHITGPISLIMAIIMATFLLQAPTENKNKLMQIYYKNPVLIGLLPIFISLGLFLMWRFDKAYLTMLWVVEIAAVVSIGFILRSKALVHIALAFLIFCVGRLIIYDLAQTTLIIKAMVFIVVGLLMILIHVIYKKFASRLL